MDKSGNLQYENTNSEKKVRVANVKRYWYLFKKDVCTNYKKVLVPFYKRYWYQIDNEAYGKFIGKYSSGQNEIKKARKFNYELFKIEGVVPSPQ